MTELTDIQQQIKTSLITAIISNNLKTVQETFNSNGNDDIQAALRHKGILTSDKGTILDFVIGRLEASVNTKKENVGIIELIWKRADQNTRDFLCGYEVIEHFGNEPYTTGIIDDLKRYQRKIDPNNTDIYPVLAQVIQEMEEHKRVKDLNIELMDAIESLDVNQVKAALENCGTDAARVLERELYWTNSVDLLLVYPLIVDYERNPDKEELKKIKEITKLLWDKASHDVRNSWLKDYMVNREGQNTGRNYIIDSLEEQQERFRDIAGEGWLEDFIQEVKDYRKDREIELNEPVLKEVEEKERIAQNDREIAERLQNEEQNTFMSSINSTDVAAAPEKNDTNFWSEHKGKIALGVTGLCVAGAVAAYVLAYPVVALALAALAAVILIGAGIAKVREKVENPSVEKQFTTEQGVQH